MAHFDVPTAEELLVDTTLRVSMFLEIVQAGILPLPQRNMTAADVDDLREQLAALEHRQWALWAADIAATEQINPIRRARWKRLISTPYMELTEAEKDQDREWADKVLTVIADNAALWQAR